MLPIEQYKKDIADLLIRWHDSPILEAKTSGSTGTPKIIELPKVSVQRSAELTIDYFDLRRGDTFLVCLPVQFIAGMLMVIRADLLGATMIPIVPSSNPLRELVDPIDFAALTPLQLEKALELNPQKISLVKKMILGGAPISHQLYDKILALNCDTRFYHTYGMTETITHVAIRDLNATADSDIFKALKGILFQTTDDGRLMIFADHLDQKSIITNDIVELLDSARFKWLDRADFVINSGGLKIFPTQLEARIRPFCDYEFFVTAEDDEALGQKLVLIIVDPLSAVNIIDLSARLVSQLPKNHAPKKIYRINQ